MRIDNIEKYEDLEIYFKKRRKIKFSDDVKIESRKDVLLKTYDPYTSFPTFYVKGSLHCDARKARSISDILLLLNYYFPDFTLRENFQYIQKFATEIPPYNDIKIFYCRNIRKHNFHGGAYYFDYGRKFLKENRIKLIGNLNVNQEFKIVY